MILQLYGDLEQYYSKVQQVARFYLIKSFGQFWYLDKTAIEHIKCSDFSKFNKLCNSGEILSN